MARWGQLVMVELRGFRDDDGTELRPVMVPRDRWSSARTDAELCDLVWYYGQNDFQPLPIRSLMVGDVIVLPPPSDLAKPARYQIESTGFSRLEQHGESRVEILYRLGNLAAENERLRLRIDDLEDAARESKETLDRLTS